MTCKRSKSENKGKVPTEMELVLELTQQGSSHEVSSSDDDEDVKDDGSHSGDKVTTDNDVERVSESSCMHNNDLLYDKDNNIIPDKDKVLSEDPFNLYDT
ncbi:hypothetical protein Tco_1096124, partial [Tanacetum coccineum]